MAAFNNLALTTNGIKALLDAQSGTTLILSKIGMGSGTATTSPINLTSMVDPKLMIPVSEKSVEADSSYVTITAKMTNEDITQGFYWRETGLFYEDANGNDVLFAYACIVDDQYDYVPAYSDERYVKHIRIANVVNDAADVTIKDQEGLLYVDTLTFNEFKESILSMLEKAGLSDFGLYSADSTYSVGEYCIHENILYICITAIDTPEAFNPDHWSQTSISKEIKKMKSALKISIPADSWSLEGDIYTYTADANVISGELHHWYMQPLNGIYITDNDIAIDSSLKGMECLNGMIKFYSSDNLSTEITIIVEGVES